MTDKLINIRYSPVSGDVTIKLVSAKSDVKVVSTNSEVTPVATNSEVPLPKINVVVVGAEESSVPTSGKYQRALSAFIVNETNSKVSGKTLQSNLLVSDIFFTTANFNRVFLHAVNRADISFAVTAKLLQSNYTSAEVFAAISSVHKNSIAVTNTVLAQFVSIYKNSAFISSDIRNIATLKFVSNTVLTAENLQRTIDYNKSFFDFVDITDDYYGLSNVDDDQTAYVDKRLISVFYGTEISSRALLKFATSQAIVAETRKVLIQPQKLEQVLFADISTRRPRKNNVEVIQKSDLASKLYNKPLKETPTASDTEPVKLATKSELEFIGTDTLNFSSVYKNTQQTAVFTEIVYPALTMPREFFTAANVVLLENKLVNITKADQTTNALVQFMSALLEKTETIELTESFATVSNYNRNFYSHLYATDDYYGQANLDDDQIAAFNKALINIVQHTDVHSIFSETNRSSILTTNSNLVEKNTGTTISTPYASSDTTSSLTAKLLQNGFTASDVTSILSGFFLFSAANVQDNLKEFIFDKILDSTSTSTEIISSTPTKALNTVATLVDPKSFYLAATANSQVVSAISLAKASQVVYENSVGNTSHPAIFASNLNLLTSISSVQDLIDVLSSLSYSVLSQVLSQDTGYANNQNYFSQAYVEPGYVGTNSYFS